MDDSRSGRFHVEYCRHRAQPGGRQLVHRPRSPARATSLVTLGANGHPDHQALVHGHGHQRGDRRAPISSAQVSWRGTRYHRRTKRALQILGGLEQRTTGATIVSNGTLQAGDQHQRRATPADLLRGQLRDHFVGTGATTATLALNTFNATIGFPSRPTPTVVITERWGHQFYILTFGSSSRHQELEATTFAWPESRTAAAAGAPSRADQDRPGHRDYIFRPQHPPTPARPPSTASILQAASNTSSGHSAGVRLHLTR